MTTLNPYQQKVFDLCKEQKPGSTVYVVGPRRSGLSTIAKELATQRPTWCVHDHGYGSFDDVTRKCPRTLTKYNETPIAPLTSQEGTFVLFTPDGVGTVVIPENAQKYEIVFPLMVPAVRFVVYIAV